MPDRHLLLAVLVPVLALAAGPPSVAAPDDEEAAARSAPRLDLGPFSLPMIKGWKKESPRSAMRKAQLTLPPPKEEGVAAELVVFHFPGTGGTVEANITRWIGQFEKPEGMKEEEFAKTERRRVDALPVTVLKVRGRYLGGRMPGRPAPKAIDDARMVAIIVETSEGPWFIKITGPRETIDHHRGGIDQLLRGLKRGAEEPAAPEPTEETDRPDATKGAEGA
ncbi:MAG: hypothetical protein ACO4CW_14645 [Planctomycetota bacterium]